MNRTLLILPLIIISSSIGYVFHMLGKSSYSEKNINPECVVSASKLFNEYELIEATANTKYYNKMVEVTGIVREIKSTLRGDVSIKFETENSVFSVTCTLASENKKAIQQIHLGQEISLTGTCKGMLMDVFISNCEIQ